jgi:hypothetical protein
MRSKLAVALVAPMVLLMGCGGSKHPQQQKIEGPVVPWVSAIPSQLAVRPPVANDCKAADLKPDGQIQFSSNGQGGAIAVLALKNHGSQACKLDGEPTVKIVHDGKPEQTDGPIARPPLIFPDTQYPLSYLKNIKPGEVAGLTITWTNWCDPAKGKARVAPKAVRVTLPNGGGDIDADYNAVPQCQDPTKGSTVGISPFESAKVASQGNWTDEPGAISASIPNQPVSGRRGEMLHFYVVFKNTSRATVRFVRCPAYVQQLVPAGQVDVRQLNCAHAKPIPPGKTEAFAMQIAVPKNAPLGGNGLFWGLDPFGAKQPEFSARATIAAGVKQ